MEKYVSYRKKYLRMSIKILEKSGKKVIEFHDIYNQI